MTEITNKKKKKKLCILTFPGHSLVQVWNQLRLDTFAGVQGFVLGSKESNKLLQIRIIKAIFQWVSDEIFEDIQKEETTIGKNGAYCIIFNTVNFLCEKLVVV